MRLQTVIAAGSGQRLVSGYALLAGLVVCVLALSATLAAHAAGSPDPATVENLPS